MAQEWIVRVGGKEYGPVDLDSLREWHREGRLIRENEIREAGSEQWIQAGELVEIFADENVPSVTTLPAIRQKGLGEILIFGWQIYMRGFGRFFSLSLLVAVPSFVLQLAAPFLKSPATQTQVAPTLTALVIAFLMLVALVIAWPFSVAGMQLLAADLSSGASPSLGNVLHRAKPLWTRVLLLGFVVYGSYFFWTILPMLVALSLATSPGSMSTLLVMLLLLIFAAYMALRLFVNFLFWQQSGALGPGHAIEALRESKELARSGKDRSRVERPLYRGALIASLWLLAVILINIAIELPFALYQMRNVTTLDQAVALAQRITTGGSLDLISGLATLLTSLGRALLRPLLVALFVVLYLETKTDQRRS